MPGLQHIDYKRLVRQWYEMGHYSAISEAKVEREGADAQSLVVQRLEREEEERSHTPIGTVPAPAPAGEGK